MPDLSIYAAVIAGAAGVGGATIPALANLIRDVFVAKRDKRERKDAERDQACLNLFGSAQQLRTKVANAANYHGAEMGVRLEEIRACASEVKLHSANVQLHTTEKVRALAASLADAVDQLTILVEQSTNMQAGEMDPKPDLTALDESMRSFQEAVVGDSMKRQSQ